MAKTTIELDDEELTQYFENPVKFERYLSNFFPKITYMKLGNWIDSEQNSIELEVHHESYLDVLLRERGIRPLY